MTGKAPLSRSRKDRPRSTRPYDRPNQSILGKVASTVKGLLTPTWLYNVSSWVRTNNEEREEISIGAEEANPEDANLTENEDEPEVQPPRARVSSRLKRPRLECHDNTTSTPEVPFWLGPSTSRDSLSQDVEKTAVQPVVSDCDSARKETPVIVNGDDHSENSDGSASTSGCSSLVSSHDKPHRSSGLKLSESALELLRGELKNKPSFQHQRKEAATITTDTLESSHNLSRGSGSLWSCGTQTPIKSPQVPSLLNCSRPSFSVSSFGGPSKGNSSGSKISSPFYEGNVTYGGASAYRRRSMTSTPYQLNPTKSIQRQVRVKENTSSKDFECMSSAAKRILHTLETMSTPITDAKKIPNVCRSPLDIPLAIAPPSQRMKSYLSISRTSPAPVNKGPPIVNLNTVSKLTMLRNHRSKVRTSMMELPLREQPMETLPEECSAPKPQDTSDTSSHLRSGGGKMRSILREPLHASSKKKVVEEAYPECDLPCVPFPISGNMPVFKFHTDAIPNKTAVTSGEDSGQRNASSKPADSNHELAYTFASPIAYAPPKYSLQSQKAVVESSFKFSSPLVATTTSKKEERAAPKEEIYSNRSVDDILKSFGEKPHQLKDEQNKTRNMSKTPKVQEQAPSPSVSGPELKSSSESKSWTCSKCDRQIASDHKSCTACGDAKEAANNKSENKQLPIATSGFTVQIQPGSWECKTCLVRNKPGTSKCLACETPDSTVSSVKPPAKSNSGFGDKFKPKEGTWECSVCMVRNDSAKDKCLACETPRKSDSTSGAASVLGGTKSHSPIEVPTITSGGNKLFQNTAGTWECDTCLVRNTLDKIKCVACETLRPSNEKTAGVSNSAPFKFNANASNSNGSTFKFGSFVSTSVPTAVTSTFKFGCPAEPAKSTPLTSTFSFGSSTISPASIFGNNAPAKASDAATDSSAPKEEVKAPTETFKFGVPIKSVAASENSKPSDKTISAPSVGLSGFQVMAPLASVTTAAVTTTVTTTTAASSLFQFPKPAALAETSSSSGGFQFGKPSVATSVEAGGFKLPIPNFGSSPLSAVKFGADVPQAATTKTTDTSSAPEAPKDATDGSKSVERSDVPRTAVPSITTGSATAGFSFQPLGAFPTIAVPSVAQVENPKTSAQEQTPRTQANPPTFSFGVASTSSMFSFGGTSQVSSSSSLTSTAAANTVDAVQKTQKASGIFNFGAASKTESDVKQAGFAFKTTKDDKVTFPQPNQPSFGTFKAEGTGNTSVAPAVSSSAPFTFGAAAAPSSGGFIFGATTKADTTAMPGAQFTFGSGPPKPSTFGGFQQSQPAVTSSMPTFSFGSTMSIASTASAFNPTGAPTFTFAAKGNQPTSLNPQHVAGSATAFGSQNVQPVFGANTAATPSFGNTAATPAFGSTTATPAFGSVPAPKPESSGGFNFNPQQSSTNLFTFGASAEKKPAMTPSQGSGFNFGMSPQVDTNTNFTPSFNMVSPPSFNFAGGVTSTPNQPFQFAASTEVSSAAPSSAPRKIRKAIRRGIRKD